MTPDGQVQVAHAMKEAVKRWHEDLCNDPAIRALVQDEDEGNLAPMEAKFEPVGNAVQSLVESLERSAVHPDLISEIGDMLDIMTELCMRAACSDPSTSSGTKASREASMRIKTRSLGIAIQSTALGRRASASYRLFDRLGGWETLSAAVDGVYRRLMKDPGMSNLQAEQEQTLKTNMLELMTAALAGKHGGANGSLWMRHNEVVSALGLPATYFDCMLEHLQSTLDELGLPHDDIHAAIEVLKTSRVTSEVAHGAAADGGDRVSWGSGYRTSFSGKSRLGRGQTSCSGTPPEAVTS